MIPIKTSDHFRYFIMGSAITPTRRKIKCMKFLELQPAIYKNLENFINLPIFRVLYLESCCMNLGVHNDHYLNPLLNKASKKANKTIFFLGNFNTDLSNFNTSEYVSTFLDDLASDSMQPQILLL